jgi:hypothetical protein
VSSSAAIGPDLWAAWLYEALCGHVRALADLPPGQKPRFIDGERQDGHGRPRRLSTA